MHDQYLMYAQILIVCPISSKKSKKIHLGLEWKMDPSWTRFICTLIIAGLS